MNIASILSLILVVAWAPAGEQQPGWQSATVQATRYVTTEEDVADVGFQLMGGVQHVTGEAGVDRDCEDPILCFSDGAPGFSSSWAGLIGAFAEMRLRLGPSTSFVGSLGLGYLLGGLNAESRLILGSVGVSFAIG